MSESLEVSNRTAWRALTIENPYWDVLDAMPRDPHYPFSTSRPRSIDDYPYHLSREERDKLPRRRDLVARYSWAIASPEAVAFVLEHLDGRPVVEIGAGTGYWGWLLTQAGIDVNAYDIAPPKTAENHWHSPRSMVWREYSEEERADHREHMEELTTVMRQLHDSLKDTSHPMPEPPLMRDLPEGDWRELPDGTPGAEWIEVAPGDASALALPENQTRVLFLSWPPYDDSMGEEVVKAFQGDTIIYVGECEGGCCGTDGMFAELRDRWNEVAECGQHVQWSGIHDQIIVFNRKAPSDGEVRHDAQP